MTLIRRNRNACLRALYLVSCCALLAGQVVIQPIVTNPSPAELERAKKRSDLLDRTGRLKKSMVLDRDTYLLGESIRMEITIENPLALPVEILSPFTCDAGGINAWFLHGKEWQDLLPEHNGISPYALPVTLLGGWQKLSRTVESWEKLGCIGALAQPELPGYYRISYSYGGPTVQFRVIQAQFKSRYEVPLAKPDHLINFNTKEPLRDPKTGKFIDSPRELRLAVLHAEGKYYLVVTSFARTPDGSVRIEANSELDYSAGQFLSPFTRIAESSEAITSVTASADADENLVVHWFTSDSQNHSISMDSRLRIIETTER